MDRRTLLRSFAAALPVALAGCGAGSSGDGTDGGDGGEAGATPSPSAAAPTATPGSGTPGGTATPDRTAATPEPTPTGTPTPTATPAAAQVVRVGADGFNFAPASFSVAVGDTVRWVWDSGGHNVVPDATPDGSTWRGTEDEDGGTYDPGYVHSHTFETPGEYRYFCRPHRSLDMRGAFTVTD